MKYNLFLDDIRIPANAWNYMKDSRYLHFEWEIVRNYDEFVDHITKKYKEYGVLPQLISFDHDLSYEHYGEVGSGVHYDQYKEKTGYDCAKWLVNFCIDNKCKIPKHIVHSANPIGADNIYKYLYNYEKYLEKVQ